MFNLKIKQTLTILIILSLLALAGCNQSGTDKSKELELKEKSNGSDLQFSKLKKLKKISKKPTLKVLAEIEMV